MSERVRLVSWGLIGVIVCAPKSMSQQEVEQATNLIPGCQASAGWTAQDKFYGTDIGSPGQCEEDSEWQHWYLTC